MFFIVTCIFSTALPLAQSPKLLYQRNKLDTPQSMQIENIDSAWPTSLMWSHVVTRLSSLYQAGYIPSFVLIKFHVPIFFKINVMCLFSSTIPLSSWIYTFICGDKIYCAYFIQQFLYQAGFLSWFVVIVFNVPIFFNIICKFWHASFSFLI